MFLFETLYSNVKSRDTDSQLIIEAFFCKLAPRGCNKNLIGVQYLNYKFLNFIFEYFD